MHAATSPITLAQAKPTQSLDSIRSNEWSMLIWVGVAVVLLLGFLIVRRSSKR